jgi:hypothetical protein
MTTLTLQVTGTSRVFGRADLGESLKYTAVLSVMGETVFKDETIMAERVLSEDKLAAMLLVHFVATPADTSNLSIRQKNWFAHAAEYYRVGVAYTDFKSLWAPGAETFEVNGAEYGPVDSLQGYLV